MDELYKEYGELMVKQELLQNQINAVKDKINKKLNEPTVSGAITENNPPEKS